MRNLFFCVITILIIFTAHKSFATPMGLTLQGRLVKNDTAVSGAVTLVVQVTSPNSDICLLYEESHSLNISPTDGGSFSVKIGGGTRTGNDKGLSLVNVFSNNGATISSLTCSGGPATSYTPASTDGRYVYISFINGADTVSFSSPYVVQSVPYALEAERLSGKSSSEFLQTTADTTQAKLNSIMTAGSFSELTALVGGSSTKYMSYSSSAGTTIPSLASAPSSPVAGQIWFDSGSSTIKYYNGSSTQTLTNATSGIVNGGQSGAIVLGTNDANSVTVNTNGAARMTVTSAGNVGIGTTTPSNALEIQTGASTISKVGSTNYSIQSRVVDGNGVHLEFGTFAVPSNYMTISAAGGTNNINTTNRDFKLYSTAASQGFIFKQDTGKVGIGTTSPSSLFSVVSDYGGNNDWGQISASGSTNTNLGISLGYNTTGDYAFLVSRNVGVGGKPLYLNGSSVGIGTTTPSNKLDVSGNLGVRAGNGLRIYNPADTFYSEASTDATGKFILKAGNGELVNRSISNITMQTWDGSSYVERMRVATSGKVGIGTNAPDAPLEVSKTDTTTSGTNYGLKITPTYNQSSSTAANTDLYINRTQTEIGSGTQYLIDARVGGVSKFYVRNDGVVWTSGVFSTSTIGSSFYNGSGNSSDTSVTINTKPLSTASFGVAMATGTSSHTSGSFSAVKITPTYNQSSSTAANTDFLINRTETAVGSGAQLLFDAQVGGTSKFNVSNTGDGYFAGNVGIGTASPTKPLDVVGEIKSSTIVTAPNMYVNNLNEKSSATNAKINLNSAKTVTISTDNTDRLFVGATGNVGIGTTSPSYKVSITGTTNIAGSGGESTGGTLQIGNGAAGAFSFVGNGTTGNAVINNANTVGGSIDIQRRGNSAIFINGADGNVGIGTSTPGGILELSNGTDGTRFVMGASGSVTISNTNASGSLSLLPDNTLNLGTSATDVVNIGRTTLNNFPIIFNSFGGETMRIVNNNVGIGTASPDEKLVVANGTTTGKYTTAGWTHSSDRRLKHDIKPIENSLEKILQLRGVEYKFNSDPNSRTQVGFVAQEVEPIFPEVVVTDNKGFKSMIYSNLVAPVIEAIKAIYERIKNLEEYSLKQDREIASHKEELQAMKISSEDEIKKLKAENEELKSRLEKIEKTLNKSY